MVCCHWSVVPVAPRRILDLTVYFLCRRMIPKSLISCFKRKSFLCVYALWRLAPSCPKLWLHSSSRKSCLMKRDLSIFVQRLSVFMLWVGLSQIHFQYTYWLSFLLSFVLIIPWYGCFCCICALGKHCFVRHGSEATWRTLRASA